MAVSIYPPISSETFTDEGGAITYSAFISETSVIPVSDLPSGEYFFTFSGSGDVSVREYDSSNLLGKNIAEVSISGRKTSKVTVPSGTSGIYISGTFVGSLIIQQIPVPASAVVSSTVWNTDYDFSDYSYHSKVRDSELFINFSNTTAVVTDSSTNASVSATIGGRNTGNQSWQNYGNSSVIRTSSGALITNGGYAGSEYNSYIKRRNPSTGAWSTVATIPGIDYNPQNLVLADGSIVVAGYWNGYGQRSMNYHFSVNDGVSWTLNRTYPDNGGGAWGKQHYLPSANLYIVMAGRDQGSQAQQNYTQNYLTSPDRTTWTLRTRTTNSTTKDVTASIVFNGALYVFSYESDGNSTISKTTDGTSWTQIFRSSLNSYWTQPSTNYSEGITIEKDSNGNDYKLWIGHEGNTRRYSITTSDTVASVAAYSQSPFSTGSSAALSPQTLENGTRVIWNSSSYDAQRPWIDSSNSTASGILVMANSFPARQSFYAKDYDRWYFMNSQSVWHYTEPGDSIKFSNQIPNQGAGYGSNMVQGNGYICFVQYGYFFKSTDGVTWTKTTINANVNTGMNAPALVYWNGILIWSENNSSNSYINISKDDGASWSRVQLSNNNNLSNNWNLWALKDGIALGSTNNGSVWYTSTGDDFTQTTATWGDSFPIHGQAYFPNSMITSSNSAGSYRRYVTASGGSSALTMPSTSYYWATAPMGNYWISTISGANHSTTNKNYYVTSPDGTTWTYRYDLSNKTWVGPSGGSGSSVLFYNTNTNVSYGGISIAKVDLEETISIG